MPIPPNVRFVPADLSREPLAAVLARGKVSRVVPAFFSSRRGAGRDWVAAYFPARQAIGAAGVDLISCRAPGHWRAFYHAHDDVQGTVTTTARWRR